LCHELYDPAPCDGHSAGLTPVGFLGCFELSGECFGNLIRWIRRVGGINSGQMGDRFVEFLSIHIPIITVPATGTSL